jgi:hypothetical protein
MNSEQDRSAVDDDSESPGPSRSPRHPALTLNEAVEKVRVIYGKFRQHPVSMKAALELLELRPTSSSGKTTLAALKAYGLIEYLVAEGSPSTKIKVTDSGARIVGGHSSASELLKTAALAPKLHREVWDRYYAGQADGPAPDKCILEYLVFDRDEGKFPESAADRFLGRLQKTFEFAKLSGTSGTGARADQGANDHDGGDAKDRSDGAGTEKDIFSQFEPNFESLLGPPNHSATPVTPTTSSTSTTPPTKDLIKDSPPAPSQRRNEVMHLKEGPVLLQLPAPLCKESVEDLDDFFQLCLKRLRRLFPESDSRST